MNIQQAAFEHYLRFIDRIANERNALSIKIPWYRMRFKRSQHPVNRISKYQPHQGTQERARRVRQIAEGRLHV